MTLGVRLVVRIRRVGIAAHDGTAVGEQTGVGEALRTKSLTSTSCKRRAIARALADQLEGGGADLVDAAAGFQMGLQRLGSPARFEDLNQLGGGDHFHAQAAYQFHRAGVHDRDVGHGAHGGVGHGDALHAGGELAEGGDLLGPTGVGDLFAGQAGELVALDAMLHSLGLALGGDHVIPAARGAFAGGEAEDPVGQRVAQVVIEEEPPVQLLFAKFLLNVSEVHGVARQSSDQTPFQIFLRYTLNLYNLEAACQARDDPYARTRHAGELREEAHALVIRLAVHRRRGQRELPGVAEPPGQGGAPGTRMHLHRDTRHSTLALRFATPAATRVSTTSKAMVSSSQSWLEPSASCVATVRVYCCGVSQHASWKSTSSSSPACKSPSDICSMRVLVP